MTVKLILSSIMTYHKMSNKSIATTVTTREGDVYPSAGSYQISNKSRRMLILKQEMLTVPEHLRSWFLVVFVLLNLKFLCNISRPMFFHFVIFSFHIVWSLRRLEKISGCSFCVLHQKLWHTLIIFLLFIKHWEMHRHMLYEHVSVICIGVWGN